MSTFTTGGDETMFTYGIVDQTIEKKLVSVKDKSGRKVCYHVIPHDRPKEINVVYTTFLDRARKALGKELPKKLPQKKPRH